MKPYKDVNEKFICSSWFYMFKKYSYIKGFIIRICGVYINVREDNATEKLIAIANAKN